MHTTTPQHPSTSVLQSRVCVCRLLSGISGLVTTLQLKGVPPPPASPYTRLAAQDGHLEALPAGITLVAAPEPVASASGSVDLVIDLPDSYHFTAGAPNRFEVKLVGSGLEVTPQQGNLDISGGSPAVQLRFRHMTSLQNPVKLRTFVKIYFCQGEDVCLFDEACFEVTLVPASTGSMAAVQLRHTVRPPV